MRRTIGRTGAGLLGSSLLALAATTAAAQTSEAPNPADGTNVAADAEGGTPNAVGDIVVTARKREERLRDVPVAVAAITGDQLEAKNITQVIDLPATTPNFQFSYGAVQPFIFIRGFGSGANASFEQSVGKFVDNVSFGRDQDGRIPLFDLERLEVLKGPQVLAFGNSATVGALNITTRKPGRDFAVDAQAIYEFNRNEVQVQGGVTAPMADWPSLRVAGLFQDLAKGRLFNPQKDLYEPQSRNWAVRPSLRLTPTSDLEIVLQAEYDRVRDYGSAVQVIGQPLNPAVPRFREANDRDVRIDDFSAGPIASRELGGINAQLYRANIGYDLLGGTLTSTTAWRKTRSASQFGISGTTPGQGYFNALYQRFRQFSQELRFNGTYGALDVAGGGYYQNDFLNIDLVQYFQLGSLGFTGAAATPFGRIAQYDQRTKTGSAFVDLTYRLSDTLSVSGGVRYSDIRKRGGQAIDAIAIAPGLTFDTPRRYLDGFRSVPLRALLGPVAGSTAHTFPFGMLRLKETHWQPQAIVQWKPSPDTMIYGKYVKGDKVGGFDFLYAGTNPAAARFRPEKAESFEIGAKGVALAGTLEYALAAFRTTFTSLQQSVFSNLVFVVSNVGEARSQGIEADLAINPAEGLKISLAGSYLDAKFVDFPGAACGSAQNLATPRGCFQDLSGTRTQYASKWSGTAAIDYVHRLSDGYALAAGASMLARSRYNAGAYNDPRMEQAGFAQVDAHLDVKPTDGWWTLSLFTRNLTDRKPLEYAVLVPGSSTAVAGTYARGRQIGVRLGVDFK